MKNIYESFLKNFDLLQIEIDGDLFLIRPIQMSRTMLKVVMTVKIKSKDFQRNPIERRFTDRLDLYCASARKYFSENCAQKLFEDESYFEDCLEKVIGEIEKKIEIKIKKI